MNTMNDVPTLNETGVTKNIPEEPSGYKSEWSDLYEAYKKSAKSYRDLMYEYIKNSKTITSHKVPCWIESHPKFVLICVNL